MDILYKIRFTKMREQRERLKVKHSVDAVENQHLNLETVRPHVEGPQTVADLVALGKGMVMT